MTNELILNNGIILNNLSGHEDAINKILSLWKEKGYVVVNYIYWASYPLIGKDERYTSALRLSDFILPDGIGMLLYVKRIFKIKLNNLNGTDLNPLFINYLTEENIPFAFYGASEDSITKACS